MIKFFNLRNILSVSLLDIIHAEKNAELVEEINELSDMVFLKNDRLFSFGRLLKLAISIKLLDSVLDNVQK